MRSHSLLDQLWEMDKEKSFALLTTTPIKEGDRSYYLVEGELSIRPYPNPFSYGGFWSQGTAKTTEELDRIIASFRSEVAEWQERGLAKIEIIRKPEMTIVEHKNERRREWLKRHPDDTEKATVQPSLM